MQVAGNENVFLLFPGSANAAQNTDQLVFGVKMSQAISPALFFFGLENSRWQTNDNAIAIQEVRETLGISL